VRWCTQCHEPVRELTPRERVWRDGEFVDQPVHTGGAVPHWSRWEGTATTLGPWGRIVLTIALLATLPLAGVFGMFMYVIWFPVIAVVGLRGIWAKGWVVPGAASAPRAQASDPREAWVWDRGEILRNLFRDAPVRPEPGRCFVVIVAAVVVGGAAALRWVRGDR
jgi:hypothetical protein